MITVTTGTYFCVTQVENGDALHDRGDVILRRYDDVVPVVAVHKSSLTTASEGTSPRSKAVPHGTSPVGAKIMKKIRKKMQPEEDESRDKADDITFTQQELDVPRDQPLFRKNPNALRKNVSLLWSFPVHTETL